MKRHRSHSHRIHFSTLLWFTLVLISLGSVNLNIRLMSDVMTKVLIAQQAAIDQPRQRTVQTIQISQYPTHSSTLGNDELKAIETLNNLGGHGTTEKETVATFSNVEMVFRQKLLEQNLVEKDLQKEFPYKLGLVRLIGNPIQGNHNAVHTLQNLEFLLRHEPKFKATVHKHWILNRISDDDFLNQTKRILQAHNQTFSMLPFDVEEHKFMMYQSNKARNEMLENSFGNGDQPDQKRRLYPDESFRAKYIYLTNQNSARNFALSLYRKTRKEKLPFEIDYILPWDGDCFLSQSAHDSLQRDLKRHNDEQQMRIARARIILTKETRADDAFNIDEGLDDDFVDSEISNLIETRSLEKLINTPIKYFYTPIEKFEQSAEDFKPIQNENDLQLIFHRTAKARFDCTSPSMVWMLKKLKIRGPWDIGNPLRPIQKDYNFHQFSITSSSSGEKSKEEPLSMFENFDIGSPAVGWVTRLFSSEST